MVNKEGKPVASGKKPGIGGHHRMVFFIRCHIMPEFVADTIDAIRYYATEEPLIVVTVDRNERIEEKLSHSYPGVLFYTSPNNCGWGGGLFRLFCEAMTWLLEEKQISFDYLWNVDYDLLPIHSGFDEYFVRRFDKPAIGQIGRYNPNAQFWIRRMRLHLNKLKKTFDSEGKQWPRNYKVGDHVAGACGVFKGACVAQMYKSGLLKSPFRDLGVKCQLADDPMLSLTVAAAGYCFREMGEKAYIKWRMEEDYRRIPSKGYYIYHPTKLVPGNQAYSVHQELECRNFFRGIRRQGRIKLLPDSPRQGKPNSITC